MTTFELMTPAKTARPFYFLCTLFRSYSTNRPVPLSRYLSGRMAVETIFVGWIFRKTNISLQYSTYFFTG